MFRGTSLQLFLNIHVAVAITLALVSISLLSRAAFGQIAIPKTEPEIAVLETGKAVEREIAGGSKYSYQIILSANQYARAVVAQHGIDVAVRLFDEGGTLISEFDSSPAATGEETAEIFTPTAAKFRLDIEARPRNAAAGRYKIRLVEMRTGTERDKDLQEARTLLGETSALSRAGKHQEAFRSAERALAIRERVLGADSPLTAAVVNLLGLISSDMGDADQAVVFFKGALSIYEKQPGPDSLEAAIALSNLGVMLKVKGDFVEAEIAYLRVLKIREKHLGPDHNLVAAVFNNLGVLYRARGNNARSRNMYERALEIREKLFGPDSAEIALVLTNLAALCYFNGDYAAAVRLDRRVLEIREKQQGLENQAVANALDNLGVAYADGGEPAKAEPLYRRALAILEKTNAIESVAGAGVLNNLAELYLKRSEPAKAEPLLERALSIAESRSGIGRLSMALYLANLGRLYTLEGEYARAEKLLERSLDIRRKTLGDEHFDVGRTHDLLSRLYALNSDLPRALLAQQRANRIFEKNIALNIAVGTEHQKLAYLSLMAENLNQTIDLQVRMPGDDDAAELAALSVLQRKGRVLDAMTDTFGAIRGRSNAEDQVAFDRLNDVNAQLAELTLNQPPESALADFQKKVADIQEKKDRLEAEIGRRSEGFYVPSRPATLPVIQSLIPDDAALVEFAICSPIAADERDGRLAEPRYVAYVIRNSGKVRFTEIGTVAEVTAAVDALRLALRDPKRKDIQQLARAVDQKVMRPIRAVSGDAEHFLISPEGKLSLIPFEALVDEGDRYLIENYSFTYLTSGRDLVRMRTERASKSGPLVVANPAFGEPSAMKGPETARRKAAPSRGLAETYFAPLTGTAQEAKSIGGIFPNAKFLIARQATETALRRVAAPSILHIATHGFFLDDDGNGSAALAKPRIENPLLRSGLALAGANRRNGGSDDGILTALEASGLDLWGTKLVVLSACDTGVGEVRGGEGVYGLRRAFVLAGAESLVMSLWPISDAATLGLMTNYYKNLKQGIGRGPALRRVQMEMLKRTDRRHPFYWASFIQYGDWTTMNSDR